MFCIVMYHFAEFFKSCVKAQMNRLSASLWANVVRIVKGHNISRELDKQNRRSHTLLD